jgi:hypothetical protein
MQEILKIFATTRCAFFIAMSFCFFTALAMHDQQVRESFIYTVTHDSTGEVRRFVEAYKTQIDHKTFSRALHKALIHGDLSLVMFLIKEGNINVATEVFSAEYATGSKPLTALEIVDLKCSQADNCEDMERYQNVKKYVQARMYADVSDDDEEVSIKPNRICRKTSCFLLAGSLLCWYVYTVITQVFSGTVTHN